MVIALLVVLGIDLIVLVAFLAVVVGRRRWVRHQPGSFAGIACVTTGQVEQLGGKPRRGYGRWVRDVLVWTPAPLCLRNALIPIDRVSGPQSPAAPVRRLGDRPQVIALVGADITVQVTVDAHDLALLTAPFPLGPRAADGELSPLTQGGPPE